MGELSESMGGRREPNGGYDLKMRGKIKTSGRHGVFNNVDTLLALSVSHGALDSSKTKMELVKEEALNICNAFKWSDFLCVLA